MEDFSMDTIHSIHFPIFWHLARRCSFTRGNVEPRTRHDVKAMKKYGIGTKKIRQQLNPSTSQSQ